MFYVTLAFGIFPAMFLTHIYARNVSCGDGTDGWPRKFQFIYVRGMFSLDAERMDDRGSVSIHTCAWNVSKGMMLLPTVFWRFNSYMCGKCFEIS